MHITFRRTAVSRLTNTIGVYALCDLNQVPIYVGQSTDGIRARVRRHLTSARSDITANRQVDVWEIAWVWAWPVDDRAMITPLEAHLFHQFDSQSTLMNGTIPVHPGALTFAVPLREVVQIVADAEVARRLEPTLRLPRQIGQYQDLVDHILNVKDSRELRRALRAHYERLDRYHTQFLQQQSGEDAMRGTGHNAENGDDG